MVWLAADIAAKHLSSRAFTSAARRETAAAVSAAAEAAEAAEGSAEGSADIEYEDAETAAAIIAERLQEGYAELAECALLLVQTATISTVTGAASPAKLAPADAKVAGRVERGGRRVLTALDDLLAPGAYLRALSPLLDHADARVRRKALRLVAHAPARRRRRRRRDQIVVGVAASVRATRGAANVSRTRAWRRDGSGVTRGGGISRRRRRRGDGGCIRG